jgi:hypothetical protein
MFSLRRWLQVGYMMAMAALVLVLAWPGNSDAQGFRGNVGMPPPPVTFPTFNPAARIQMIQVLTGAGMLGTSGGMVGSFTGVGNAMGMGGAMGIGGAMGMGGMGMGGGMYGMGMGMGGAMGMGGIGGFAGKGGMGGFHGANGL